MFQLNADDLLNFKYLIIGTGLLNKKQLVNVKNEKLIFQLLEKDYDKDTVDDIVNESLYYLKCYNVLHKNGSCTRKYLKYDWGDNLNDESILFVRLHQNLTDDEFFYFLEHFIGINKSAFSNLEMDFDGLETEKYVPLLINWLIDIGNPFAKNVSEWIQARSLEIVSTEENPESFPTEEQFISKGICLVISNENFLVHRKRQGTQVDENTIYKTFTKLGYSVYIKQNVKSGDLFKIIEETKSKIKQSDKMFIFFALSHGKNRILITSDDKEILFDDIWKCFTSSQCTKLMKKPKLFFFVCCQGTKENQGVRISKTEFDSTMEVDGPYLDPEVDGPDLHPDVSDFFFGYATFKSFLSFRSSTLGTHYVRTLCDIIKQNPGRSIISIHTEVQATVSRLPIDKKTYFQIPYYTSLLIDENISFL